MTKLDHLVWAVPDLEAAVEALQSEWGCRIYPGGRHPAWGSHNAILPLRGGSYLEIIAPHDEPPESGARIFGLDEIETRPGGALQAWGLRPLSRGEDDPMARLTAAALSQGLDLGDVLPGSRRTPDGTLLTWEITDPFTDRLSGIAPFLIHWGDTPQPSQLGAPEVELLELEIGHPMAIDLERYLMGLECTEMVAITATDAPLLRALLRVPTGTVELTGPVSQP